MAAEALLGMTLFGALGDSATQMRNASAYERQAAQVQNASALNESLEAREAASEISGRRAYEAGSGLLDPNGTIVRELSKRYQLDRAIRKYNSDVEAGALRSEAASTRLQAGTSLIGSIGKGLMTYDLTRTPKEKE